MRNSLRASLLRASLPASGGLLAISGVLWLIDAFPRPMLSRSHGVLCVRVSISVSKFPLFYKDTSPIGLGPHPNDLILT